MIACSGGSGGAGVEEGDEHRRFSLSIGLAQVGAEDFDAALEFIGRHRGASQQKNAQAGVIVFADIGVGQQSVKGGWRKKKMSDAVVFDSLQYLQGVETGEDDVSSADREHSECNHAGGVRER